MESQPRADFERISVLTMTSFVESNSHGLRRAGGIVLVLLLASMVSTGILFAWIVRMGYPRHLYLVWNLFLAWIPLGLAGLTFVLYHRQQRLNWLCLASGCSWLLFFPNAPYIATDLIHLRVQPGVPLWFDLVLILSFAWTGLLLGFVSLYLMHRLVAASLGFRRGWLFVVAVSGLSAYGIYLGRFLRWNSWDILVSPLDLLRDASSHLSHPVTNRYPLLFTALFATFLLVTYVTLYALARVAPRAEDNLNAVIAAAQE